MEIDDETIRRIIREAVGELGDDVDPALLRKIVREVIRELERRDGPSDACDCHEQTT